MSGKKCGCRMSGVEGRSFGNRGSLDMRPRYAPTHVAIDGHFDVPVERAIFHPAGNHKGPIRADIPALELRTRIGSRWYGVVDAYINSELRMVVVGTDIRDEVRMKWPVVPVKYRHPEGREYGRTFGTHLLAFAGGFGAAMALENPEETKAIARATKRGAEKAYAGARGAFEKAKARAGKAWWAFGYSEPDSKRFKVAEGPFQTEAEAKVAAKRMDPPWYVRVVFGTQRDGDLAGRAGGRARRVRGF